MKQYLVLKWISSVVDPSILQTQIHHLDRAMLRMKHVELCPRNTISLQSKTNERNISTSYHVLNWNPEKKNLVNLR